MPLALVLVALCLIFLGILASSQQGSLRLASGQYNLTLGLSALTIEEAAAQCWNDSLLPSAGVLAPASLFLYTLQDLIPKNVQLLTANLRQDPVSYSTGGSSVWVLDPWGGCRAVVLPVRLASYTGAVEVTSIPCSWRLQYVCMEYSVARALANQVTLPHNRYRAPDSPQLPPAVPLGSAAASTAESQHGVPSGYRLTRSGIKLGQASPPDGAVFFSTLNDYLQLGPVVNVLGRWSASGLDAVRVVNAGDTTSVVELALNDQSPSQYNGDVPPAAQVVWGTYPLPRENVTQGSLRTSYITRVEGCSSASAVQRIILVTAAGATFSQGLGRCISTFSEEAAPGGYLAGLEGYFSRPIGTNTTEQVVAPGIVQLSLVWAVLENYTTDGSSNGSFAIGFGGIRAVAPRVDPIIPHPACIGARALIPAGPSVRGRPECGQFSLDRLACPSYMCCGVVRGRVGICGTVPSQCLLSSCDPTFGLCGGVPFETFEFSSHEGLTRIAPARSALSSGPPWTVDEAGPGAVITTATVRDASMVYVLEKLTSLHFKEAISHCRNQTSLGLSWSLITMIDAFGFETSLLARGAFMQQLDNRLAWVNAVQGTDDFSVLNSNAGCLTVSWESDEASIQVVAVQATNCNNAGSVICKAEWPAARSAVTSTAFPPPKGSLLETSASNGASNSKTNGSPVWVPGLHNLSFSLGGFGVPNSNSSCTFGSLDAILPEETISDLQSRAQALIKSGNATASGPTTALPLLTNITLTAQMAGVALRPLMQWSGVSAEPPAAYGAVGSLAIQYCMAAGTAAAAAQAAKAFAAMVAEGNVSVSDIPLPDVILQLHNPLSGGLASDPLSTRLVPFPPAVLGSEDGTYRSTNASFGATAPAADAIASSGLAAYVSAAAGWHTFQLDVLSGEVIVAVSGCRGGNLETLLLETSTGRVFAATMGQGMVCSMTFRFTAPPGGYLVGIKVTAGNLIEEVQLIWGTPVISPLPGPSHETTGGHRHPLDDPHMRGVIIGGSLGVALVVLLLSAGIVWICKKGKCSGLSILSKQRDGKAAGRGEPAAGGPHTSVELVVGGQECARAEPKVASGLHAGGDATDGGPHDNCSSATASGGVPASQAATSRTGSSPGRSGSGGGGHPLGAATGEAAAIAAAAATAASGYGGARSARPTLSGPAAAAAPRMEPSDRGGTDAGLAGEAGSCEGHDPMQGTRPERAGDAAWEDKASGFAGAQTPNLPGLSSGTALELQRILEPGSGGRDIPKSAAQEATASRPASLLLLSPGLQKLGSEAEGPRSKESGVAAQGAATGDSHVWAQTLHEALFQKVFYHWQHPNISGPPSTAHPTHIPAQTAAPGSSAGPAPAASSASAVSTPSAAAVAAVAHALSHSSSLARPQAQTGARGLSVPALGNQHATHTGTHVGTSSLRDSSVPAGSTKSGSTPLPGNSNPSGATAAAVGQQSQAVHQGLVGVWAALESRGMTGEAASGQLPLPPSSSYNRLSGASGNGAQPRSQAQSSGRTDDGAVGLAPLPWVAAVQLPSVLVPGLGMADGGAVAVEATAELLLGRDVLVDLDDPSTYLGHGTSGVVRRGVLRQPDGGWRPVAVKLLNPPADSAAVDGYKKHLKTLVQEMTILGSLRHPNVVQLLGGSVRSGASFLVEELCGMTLGHAIYEGPPYGLEQVLRWCADIARGLVYLHPNIMHRDLKPSNVLLDEAGCAKISDFGLARFKAHTTLNTRDAEVGTTCYMSPECFVSSDFKVTAACDVYSLGVMVNEIVTRQRPWSGVRSAVVGFKVAVVGERPRLPPEGDPLCPPPLRQLIVDCWAQQPEARPDSAEVLARLQAMQAALGAGPEADVNAVAAVGGGEGR